MVGKAISHYRIIEKLGTARMGVIYRAEDSNLNRQDDLKVLPEMLSGDPERHFGLREKPSSSSQTGM